jgi:hypothetical protein
VGEFTGLSSLTMLLHQHERICEESAPRGQVFSVESWKLEKRTLPTRQSKKRWPLVAKD